MQATRIHITDFLSGGKKNLILDVRSPAEFAHAHIPEAINLPLFTDEERKIVGTAYKQQSREAAIKIALDFFGPKMKKMVEAVEELSNSKQSANTNPTDSNPPHTSNPVYVYCWRGGMRSGAVSWLLNLYGYKVYTLAGGYKAYRNIVLKTFQQPFIFKILGGFTGSGKTEVLAQLEKTGERVIDLEKIASHKGSAFGSIKMPPQPSQEMFENYLAEELMDKATNEKYTTEAANTSATISPLPLLYSPIWLEDESQRIGNLNIPATLWQSIRSSPVYFLDIPFEERLNYIVEHYGHCDVHQLIAATNRIAKRLGPQETKNTLLFFEGGNIKEAFRTLLHYYDKFYLKGLHNRENVSALVTTVACKTVSTQNGYSLLNQHQIA